MDMQAAIGEERTLRRIVALLAALALLAERAAARSSPVRWLVLLILRRAERAAEAFVLEATGMPPFIERFAAESNRTADAYRLAARFRALAAALATLLPDARPRDRRPARRGFSFGNVAQGSGHPVGSRSREPHDTS